LVTRQHIKNKKAHSIFNEIKIKSKRRPYIRSAYFKKSKIFLGLFWSHLHDKQGWDDRVRRLKLFPCAIELIQKSTYNPESKDNLNRPSEILHRFYGATQEGENFCVHIKEDKRTEEKFFISVFPYRKK